ncbi:MAG TPA: patatin-like phospholipase family protein [Fimbriimonadaceae bacterium]|nr:patatin-like phospholipase family protein [Fimbriimonadaceae bacterium]
MSPLDEQHRADGVFQGGGVKGLGLVGALLQFEEDPRAEITDWVGLAGTSAGSIVACLLAAGQTPAQLEKLFMQLDFAQFEDFGPGGTILGGTLNLAAHHGLAHGEAFHRWIDEQLNGATFETVKRDPPPSEGSPYRLQMIATDITRKQMLVLPDDIKDYRNPQTGQAFDPDSLKIADAVRMSMSIPYFFQPVILTYHDPTTGTDTYSTIVDGGVLSNFPLWIFDTKEMQPLRRTFGFHLVNGGGVGGGLNTVIHDLGWAVEEAVDIFHTATDAWDARFLSHSTEVRTCTISAGTIGTTDFHLPPEQKQWLLDSGRAGAKTFLDTYRDENYMNTFGRRLK